MLDIEVGAFGYLHVPTLTSLGEGAESALFSQVDSCSTPTENGLSATELR